jgi:hypothetical protein
MRYTKTYEAWHSMKDRCLNPRHSAWREYGGRGIAVCERWLRFENFLEDMGEAPAGTTLDRVDNEGGYRPGNCRWATVKEQARNRRSNRLVTFEAVTKTLAEWCEELSLDYTLTWQRLYEMGWSVERALTSKPRAYNAPVEWRGRSQTLTEWCRELDLDYNLVRQRFRNLGWPIGRALGTPTGRPFRGAN